MSLVGVALGAGGSLLGQYLVSRASVRQLEAQEAATHRAELKAAVLKFLSLASRVEKAAFPPPGGARTAVGDEPGRLVDDLWLAQAEIDLAARSESLRGAAYRYAFRLARAARHETADASELRGPQAEFMDAAYDDMWPGQRRTTGDDATPR